MVKFIRNSPTIVGNNQYSAGVPVYDSKFGLRISGAHKTPILESAVSYEIDFRGYTGSNIVDLQRGAQENMYLNLAEGRNHPPNVSGLQFDGNSIYAADEYAAYDDEMDDARYRMRTRTSPITQGTVCVWAYIADAGTHPTARFIVDFSIWEQDPPAVHDQEVNDPGGGEAYYWGFIVVAQDDGILFGRGGGYWGSSTLTYTKVSDTIYGWHLFTVDNLAGKVYIDDNEVLSITPVSLPSATKACFLTTTISAIPLSPNLKIASLKAYDGISLTKKNLRDLYKAGPQIGQERLIL